MRTLHIANRNYSSWSLRPWVLMRMLEIPFEETLHVFGADTYQRLRRVSPTGRVPVLHEADGLVVWDSLAIAEHLAEAFPLVWPESREARAFARSVSAEMHAGFAVLRDVCTMNCGVTVALSDPPAALGRDVERIGEIFEEGLSRFGGPFLAGARFTAADAMFAPVAFRVRTYGLALPEAAAAYVRRVLDLSPMREWDRLAHAETARDAPHEADLTRFGRIVEDRRAPQASL